MNNKCAVEVERIKQEIMYWHSLPNSKNRDNLSNQLDFLIIKAQESQLSAPLNEDIEKVADRISGFIYKHTDCDDDTTWLPGDKIHLAAFEIANSFSVSDPLIDESDKLWEKIREDFMLPFTQMDILKKHYFITSKELNPAPLDKEEK